MKKAVNHEAFTAAYLATVLPACSGAWTEADGCGGLGFSNSLAQLLQFAIFFFKQADQLDALA